ncbi:MAG: hypothetical protein RLZZ543_145 [Bacteroidota bacterium]|jgi:hypothetical protein
MKKLLFGLGLLLSANLVNAQNGLESIIVEKYYVANAADAAGSVGTLPVGSVTYRFYVDMLPGYKFQVAYGNSDHTLSFNTTTSFFNNEDRGAVNPTYTKTQARANTVMLDSWLSAGAACASNFGVLKSEDDVTSGGATVVNSNGILANTDASAGIPLTTQDGLWAGAPSSVTTVGQTDAQAAIFDATSQQGSSFVLTDGAWSSLAGTQGPTSNNRILIAQLTTDGVLTYALNIQIGTPTGGVQRYVVSNPLAGETTLPSLSGTLGAPNVLPSISITSPANGDGFITGSTVNIAATASDADGSVTGVEFFVDGVSVGTDNSSPYTASYVGTIGSHVISAIATDDAGATKTATAVTINVQNNPAPSVSITSPANAASFITGDVVTITANATDNISVASVEFFVDGVSVGTDVSTPYSATYTSTLGNHSITAVATDNLSASTTSSAVSIVVVNNIPPTVSLTSPSVGALYTAPAVVTVSANAADSDGSVAQVEFFVNGVSIGVDNASPYTVDWTSEIGNAVIIARATDNRSAVTASSSITLSIADPNALPYTLVGSVNICNDPSFCLPLQVVDTVADVIGYDVVLTFDNTKVTPTGVVTVAGDVVNPSYVEVSNSINQAAGLMNISVYFNATAPASTRFAGVGELFCVEFNKSGAFAPVDTAAFTVTFLQESYFTGVASKLVDNADYVSYRDTVYEGKLKLWTDNSAIPYNVANPNQYLLTNIRGTSADCSTASATAVQPDLNGNFVYSANNGLSINIDKDILGTTDVQAVINGFDALLARRVLVNDNTFTPSVYQIVAMDVNIDGVVSAGDVSQINQRAVLIIPEFRQAWNYSITGGSDGRPSKDWLFADSLTISTNPAYAISATYPSNDGVGFSKANVPTIDFCLPIRVSNYSVCPDYIAETYVGIMVGDVNGNVATASPSSSFKSATEKVILDLNQAVYTANSVEIPVLAMSTSAVNAVDFAFQFDESKMTLVGISEVANGVESLSHFNTEDHTFRFTSNSLSSISTNRPVAVVKFATNDAVNASDLMNAAAYLNGESAEFEIIGGVTGINAVNYSDVVSVYPNPASTMINVIAPVATSIQLMDAAGRVVSSVVSVPAGQAHSISTSEIAAGVYFVKISNDTFSVMKKVVVSK